MEKISVIIPIYNIEEYLERCVNSVLQQTYENLEIILIDDGSTDSSGMICDNYSKINSNIKVFHIENAGVSNARNYGIKKATGKYISFVDGDDYLEKNMYEKMLKAIEEKEDIDIAICNYISKGKIHNINENTIYFLKDDIIEKLIVENSIQGFVWNKLFKREIIDRHNIEFDNQIHMGEDFLFCLQYLINIKKAILINEALYNYETRENVSVSCNVFSPKRFSIIMAYNYMLDLKYIQSREDLYDKIKYRKIKQEILLLKLIYFDIKKRNETKEYKKILKQEIKKFSWKYVFRNDQPIMYKLFFVFAKLI